MKFLSVLPFMLATAAAIPYQMNNALETTAPTTSSSPVLNVLGPLPTLNVNQHTKTIYISTATTTFYSACPTESVNIINFGPGPVIHFTATTTLDQTTTMTVTECATATAEAQVMAEKGGMGPGYNRY